MSEQKFLPFFARERSLTESAFWLVVAKCVAFACSFILPLILVRQMSQTQFGLYKQVFLAVNTIVTVFPLGFATSAYYFLHREPQKKSAVIWNIVLVYLVISCLAALFLAWQPSALAAVFNTPELTAYGRLTGAVVLLWTLSSFVEIVAIASGEAYLAACLVVVIQISRALLFAGAALLFTTLNALIWAALLHGVWQTAVLLYYLGTRFPGFWRKFDWPMMRAQLVYALPLGMAGLLWIAQTDLHNYVVSYRFGAAAFAIYAIGCFQLPFVGFIREAVVSVMIPHVSRLQKQGHHREIVVLIVSMMRKVAAVLLPFYFFLLVGGRELIVVLFTEEYLESWPIFVIHLTMIPLSLLASAYDPILRSYSDLLPYLLKVRVLVVLLLLPCLYVGTTHYGLIGAISAVVVVNAIERVVIGRRVARSVGFSWAELQHLKDIGKLLLASFMAALSAALARSLVPEAEPAWVFVAIASVFGAAYGLSSLWLGVLTREESDVICRQMERVGLLKLSRWVSAYSEKRGEAESS